MSELTMTEVRIIGCLVEKEFTTPDHYPLTLNALTLACNQKSNRDPVLSLSQEAVVRGLDSLRERKVVWQCASSGGRVPKYEHQFNTVYGLERDQLAMITVLMLRGPQTPGEIRTRSARLYEFTDLDEVTRVAQTLIEREAGALVTRLPRQVGRKEARFAHLLSGVPEVDDYVAAEPAVIVVQEENARIQRLEEEVASLRQEVEGLASKFAGFVKQFE